jgi:hypothetical protein
MDKELALDAIKVLSALDSIGMINNRLPEELRQQVNRVIERLTVEVLR